MITMPFDGVRVGHWTDADARTGCTVVLLPEGAVASGEVRGGGPASREFDLLDPTRTVAAVDAVVLTGGSAFGLAAADGVMGFLGEAGRGVPTPGGNVPIVPTLGIFDLANGSSEIRPTAVSGRAACEVASTDFEVGRVGVGTGATTRKNHGPAGVRSGGLGWGMATADGVSVGALVAVNSFGEIDRGVDFPGSNAAFGFLRPGTNTTIGCLLTNARLDKVGTHILAQGAHDGLARAIVPAHTRFDGDAFVAVSVGDIDAHVDLVRWLGVRAVESAILSVEDQPLS